MINDEIALGAYANKVMGSGTIIQMIDEDPSPDRPKKIFNFWNAYMLQVSGLSFYGGTTQISISNGNTNLSMFKIEHCEFNSAEGYAIEATPTEPADTILTDHLSAVLTIDHCKFVKPKGVLKNYCDYAAVNNCWVVVGKPINKPDPPYAIFLNQLIKRGWAWKTPF